MKALLMSAGYGKRLRPLTYFKPKCMVKIMGHPVLWWHINKLKAAGIDKIIVNLHYKPMQILKEFPSVLFFYEKTLLGEKNNGTVFALKHWLSGERFFVINADTLSDLDYREMEEFSKNFNQPLQFWDQRRNVYAGVTIFPSDYYDHLFLPAQYITNNYWVDIGTWKGFREAKKHYK
jgi:NDP-sugar pyrophosphorylase family protein